MTASDWTPPTKLCRCVLNPADEAAEEFFDVVPGMLEAFGSDAKRSHLLTSTIKEGVSPRQLAEVIFKQGETDMGDKGKKDKDKREQQKKTQRNPKEKRRLKKKKK